MPLIEPTLVQLHFPFSGGRPDLDIWKHKAKIAFVAFIVAMYAAALIHDLNESHRRSLQLKEVPIAGNQVDVSFQVLSFDPAHSELTALVSFRLVGDLAKDPVTPSEDLKFFVNGIRGPQVIEFPRGQRINPVIAVFAVDGNTNYYPFDRYTSLIRIIVMKTTIAGRAHTPEVHATPSAALTDEPAGDFVAAAPQEGDPLPISSSIIASVPGVKFEGERVEERANGIEGFDMTLRRASNIIGVSVLIMTLMMSLALSVFLMCLSALTKGEKLELVPLTLCVSLLFGLPALRNAQPAVPPLGVLGDYVSFLWAEVIVAFSAVMMIWIWMIRRHSASPSPEYSQSPRGIISAERDS